MPVLPSDETVIHLRSGGTSVVVDLQPDTAPAIAHWGADLGDAPHETLVSLATASRLQRVSGGLDRTVRLGVVGTAASGWAGTPTLEGHRDGEDVGALFALTDLRATEDTLELHFTDSEMQLSARYELRVTASGLVRARTTVRNDGAGVYTVQALHTTLPLPWDATEILDTTGRHLRERSAQRHELTFGTHVRESRRGRPGADFTLLLAAGTPGFGFERGTVHGSIAPTASMSMRGSRASSAVCGAVGAPPAGVRLSAAGVEERTTVSVITGLSEDARSGRRDREVRQSR